MSFINHKRTHFFRGKEKEITEVGQGKIRKIKIEKYQAHQIIIKVIDLVKNDLTRVDSIVIIGRKFIRGILKYFSLFVLEKPEVQKEIKAENDKDKLVKSLVKLGNKNRYQFTEQRTVKTIPLFTEQEVQEIPGGWQAQSAEDFLSAFLDLANGSLEHFLVTVKKDPHLQDELMKAFLDEETEKLKQFVAAVQKNSTWQKKLRAETNKDSFVQRAVELGKQNGYEFTDATDEKVQAIPGSWQAQSVEELLSVFLNAANKKLENRIDRETAQKQFIKIAMELAKEKGYNFTDEEENRLSKAFADAWYERGRIWS